MVLLGPKSQKFVNSYKQVSKLFERLLFSENPKKPGDKFQPSPSKPQRKTRSDIGLFKILASYSGSQFVLEPFGTFDLLAMQVCNPPEICQAYNQYPVSTLM